MRARVVGRQIQLFPSWASPTVQRGPPTVDFVPVKEHGKWSQALGTAAVARPALWLRASCVPWFPIWNGHKTGGQGPRGQEGSEGAQSNSCLDQHPWFLTGKRRPPHLQGQKSPRGNGSRLGWLKGSSHPPGGLATSDPGCGTPLPQRLSVKGQAGVEMLSQDREARSWPARQRPRRPPHSRSSGATPRRLRTG